MNILIIGGDSVEVFRQHIGGGLLRVKHWSGRKKRDLAKSIPKATDAIVVVLNLVCHALARSVRAEASRRGFPIYFRNRSRQIDAGTKTVPDWLDPLRYREDS